MGAENKDILFGVAMLAAGLYVIAWCAFMLYWKRPKDG